MTNQAALSWVGEIVNLQDGLVTVAWADGLQSAMGPEEIYVVRSHGAGRRDGRGGMVLGGFKEDTG